MSSACAGGVERGPRFVELLRRRQPGLRQLLRALVGHARVLEIGLRRRALRIGRGDCRFALADLLAELPLLKAQRRFALAHLRREAFGAVLVIRAVRLQLARRNHGEQLPVRDRVALSDLELGDLPGDLRAHHDIVGRDDAGEHERCGGQMRVPVVAAAGEGGDDEQGKQSLGHGRVVVKRLYETSV